MFEIRTLPRELFKPENAPLLTGILRGTERECLRVSKDGKLSQKPHPTPLGSALTHPQITTDFSEALLEFITPPTHRLDELLDSLSAIQRFVTLNLDEELLWSTSMPCHIDSDDNIPVARYGSSNNGKMKTVYRLGLGHRYGRTMQTVAGVHYNFSLPNAFWALLSSNDNSLLDLQQYKDERYFALIRNFRRHYWLLIYLFGASPAMSNSFVTGRAHNMQALNGYDDTLHLPYATSLRMGDLGYQSSAQEQLFVCYNQSNSYIQTLCCAITRKHPSYGDIGLLDLQGDYKQLSTSLLQIENEFYSAIRPKRTARPGETALSALSNRGVEYIEVRCLDVNPFSPIGITKEQIQFLDTFLLYCALQESPNSNLSEFEKILSNQKRVVAEGRNPELTLEHEELGTLPLRDWATQLIKAMQPIAEMLDTAHGGEEEYQTSLQAQFEKVKDSTKTLSGQMLEKLESSGKNFSDFTLDLSQKNHEQLMSTKLSEINNHRLQEMAEESHAEQKALEEVSQVPFSDFLKKYFNQYSHCKETTGDCT